MRCDFRQLPDGRWHCAECGYTSARAYPKAPVKTCGPPAPDRPAPSDPLHAITSRLTAAGRSRLENCRGCPVMCLINGQHTCTGMGGGKCQWLNKWAACLNSTTLFSNGSADCPHWRVVRGSQQ